MRFLSSIYRGKGKIFIFFLSSSMISKDYSCMIWNAIPNHTMGDRSQFGKYKEKIYLNRKMLHVINYNMQHNDSYNE